MADKITIRDVRLFPKGEENGVPIYDAYLDVFVMVNKPVEYIELNFKIEKDKI